MAVLKTIYNRFVFPSHTKMINRASGQANKKAFGSLHRANVKSGSDRLAERCRNKLKHLLKQIGQRLEYSPEALPLDIKAKYK